MHNKIINICKLVLLLALLLALCAIGYKMVRTGEMDTMSFISNGESVFTQTYQGVTAVETDAVSCSVRISTHSGPDTKVEIRRHGFGLSSKIQPAVTMAGGTLSIIQPRHVAGISAGGYLVEIAVPQESCLDYELSSVSGSLKLDAQCNSAVLSSTSGSIQVNASPVQVTAQSVSGSIKIYGDARTERIHAQSTSGSIKLAAGESAESIHAESTSGSIKISLPKTLGYIMDYSSVSGSVKDEYRGASYAKHGSVTQGDGQVTISATTTSGSIKLADWD